METEVVVRPGRISQFGDSSGVVFCLVTNPGIVDHVKIEQDGDYVDYQVHLISPGQTFSEVLASSIPENSHILGMSPEAFFESPDPTLVGRRKILGMACNSTPTDLHIIKHFLNIIERTSAAEQDAFSDRFFELAEASDYLEYVDERRGTRAILRHLERDLMWNQQAGALDWGDQQIVPPGEISVLPVEIREFDESLHLPLDGEITLAGYPILHNGTPSFTRGDQARIHSRLAPMEDHAVIAEVKGGMITALRPHDDGAIDVVRMIEAMFEVDSRYRYVWEIGHALNTSLVLLPGNHAMNEVYGATAGCLHWGIGLTPYTQYHLDIISPGTTVYTSSGTVLLGTRGCGVPQLATP